jgi:hypothetical protein
MAAAARGAPAGRRPGPPLPDAARVELPLLQELLALGGSEDRRRIEARLCRHFPQLWAADSLAGDPAARRRFARVVSRAVSRLCLLGELTRDRARLLLTERGRRRAEAEALHLSPPPAPEAGFAEGTGTDRSEAHRQAQEILIEIGRMLGRDARAEHDTYDVVWRSGPRAPRLSHVFEVQVRGSVDGALSRLSRAHETMRSRPFLVVADERDARFAERRLHEAFPALAPHLTLIGMGELLRLHEALRGCRPLLLALLDEV